MNDIIFIYLYRRVGKDTVGSKSPEREVAGGEPASPADEQPLGLRAAVKLFDANQVNLINSPTLLYRLKINPGVSDTEILCSTGREGKIN